jgi:hypothetical protein
VSVAGGTEDDPHILYVTCSNGILTLKEYDSETIPPSVISTYPAEYYPIGIVWLDDDDIVHVVRMWFGGDIWIGRPVATMLYKSIVVREYDENGAIVVAGTETLPLPVGHTYRWTEDWIRMGYP